MSQTAKLLASEILMCGFKYGVRQIPFVGELAIEIIEGIRNRYDEMQSTVQMALIEKQMSRIEKGLRDTVQNEIRTILTNLSRPSLTGIELTREMTELCQIYEHGWVPTLFEGMLRNSSHWTQLRTNPNHYGRILTNNDQVKPENGMHLLIDKDSVRILELPPSSLAFLLANQSKGIPAADIRAERDIWVFPAKDGKMSTAKQSINSLLETPTLDDSFSVFEDDIDSVEISSDADSHILLSSDVDSDINLSCGFDSDII
ncbi:MAG: hypothetical protein WCH39_19455 [Schlesneria sp.]